MKSTHILALIIGTTLTSQATTINWQETPESITISVLGTGFDESPEFLSPSGNWKFSVRQGAYSFIRQDGSPGFQLYPRSSFTWLSDLDFDPGDFGPLVFAIPYLDFYRLADDGTILYFNGHEYVDRGLFYSTMGLTGFGGWQGRGTLIITETPCLYDVSTWSWASIYTASGPNLASVPDAGSSAALLGIAVFALGFVRRKTL